MINYTPPIGQDKIISHFKNARRQNKLSAAYILEGESGMGKKEVAKYLTLLVMCDEDEPCLNCSKCRYTLGGTNTDIFYVSNEEKASIGIDKVREIIKEAYIMPKISDKKIFVIDNAHLLTKEAQNALLKVLEEPPQYVMFFLLCESVNFLLQTILSRTVMVRLDPLSKENLKKITLCDNDFLIEYANGCPGKLIKLMHDEEFISLRNSFFENIVYLTSGKEYDLYKIYNFFESNKDSKDTLFKMLIIFFKDVLFKKNQCENFVTNKDKMSYINAFSQNLSKKKCENILSIITKTQIEMGKYGAYPVNVHAMLIKIWEEIYG